MDIQTDQPNKTNKIVPMVLAGVGVTIYPSWSAQYWITWLYKYYPNILFLAALKIVTLPTSIPSLL